MTSDTLLATGTIVAGYEIDDLLGQGGMAVVYRATQRSLKRTVALKLLAPELSGDAEFRERFVREGQLQAGLDHLHIVPVYEAGQSEHGLFLAMRLIRGPTLKELIQTHQLDPRRTLRLLAQVAQALDAAHAAGLIHRDVKPQNILVGENEHAYLADFGLTRAPDEARLTGTGQFMGTIDYVAPEQIRGEPSGPATDCYALTAVLYECLTGEVPFERPTEAGTLQAQLTEAPPRCSERRPELGRALDDVIARGLAKDPRQRPLPTAELIRAAVQAVTAAAVTAAADPAVVPPAQPTRRRAIPPTAPHEPTAARDTDAPPPGPPAATVPSPASAMPSPPSTAPSPASADVASPPSAGRHRWVLAVVGALAVVAALAGFLIGHSGSSSGSTAVNSATVGHLELRYPAGWQLESTPPAIPGMSLSGPLTLATTRAGGTLVAGEVAATGPTLLPATFVRRLTGPAGTGRAPAPTPVALGSLDAYRYAGLSVRGLHQPVTVYAIPTSAGVATLVCLPAGPAVSTFDRRCGAVAATVSLLGASAYGLTPSHSSAQLLSGTFKRLRSAVSAPERQLSAATTPAAQAAAARRLSAAYGTAATALSGGGVSPLVQGAQTATVAALRQISTGYSRAAAAATGNSASAYAAASRQVHRGSVALAAAIRSLTAVGYRVSS